MIIPSPSADTKPYWQAAAQGALMLRYCEACATWRHPRHTHCICGNPLTWRQSSGKGALLSFTVVHYGLNPELAEQVPYTITLTRCAEGPQILTAMPGDHKTLRCGMAMTVSFDRVTPGVTLPRFQPAPA